MPQPAGSVPITVTVLADRTGRIQSWNETAEEWFGYSSAEMLGQSVDRLVPAEYLASHQAGLEQAMRTGICNSDRVAICLPVTGKAGTVRVYPARFIFLLDAQGAAAGAAVVFSPPTGNELPFQVLSAEA